MLYTINKTDGTQAFQYETDHDIDGVGDGGQKRICIQYALVNNLPLTGLDLTDADLSGMDFTGKDFTGSNLNMATLAHSTLTGATLDDCNLGQADLNSAVATNASLKNIIITKADCTNANFTGSTLTGITALRTTLFAAVFNGCIISGDLTGSIIQNATFVGADLSGGVSIFDLTMTRAPIEQQINQFDIQMWDGIMQIDCIAKPYTWWETVSDEYLAALPNTDVVTNWDANKATLLQTAKNDGRY